MRNCNAYLKKNQLSFQAILKNSCEEFENALHNESTVFSAVIFKLIFGLIFLLEGLVGLVNGINGGQQLKMFYLWEFLKFVNLITAIVFSIYMFMDLPFDFSICGSNSNADILYDLMEAAGLLPFVNFFICCGCKQDAKNRMRILNRIQTRKWNDV